MREVQVYEGQGNHDRDSTVHDIVSALIRRYPQHYAEADRVAMTKDRHEWLEQLDEVAPEHDQPQGMLKVLNDAG